MTEAVTINDKVYHSIRHATSVVPYTADYITRLARERKVTAVQLGRRWYVRVDSLQAYVEDQQQEQIIRQKHLRSQRHQERLVHRIPVSTTAKRHTGRLELMTVSAVASVLCFGVVTGSQISGVITAAGSPAAVSQPVAATVDRVSEPALQMLQVDFTAADQVFVEPDRTIVHPAKVANWQYINP